MLDDLIPTPEELCIEECISSPTADQILNFEYEGDFFEQTINPPEVPSSTNYIPPASVITTAAETTPAIQSATAAETTPAIQSATAMSGYDHSFSSALTSEDTEILSFLFNPSPSPPDLEHDLLPSMAAVPMAPIYPASQLDQMISATAFSSYSPDTVMANQFPLQLPGYLGLDPSGLGQCPFFDVNGGIGGELYVDGMGAPTCGENGDLGFFVGAGMAERPPNAAEACGYGIYTPSPPESAEAYGFGIYTPESIQNVYNADELQVLGDGQHLMARYNNNPAPLQVAADISTLDDSNYKVGRISDKERKEKIHRFLKKRNERNFSKKIKYACRKTLADSRPRVRGRFAKNDEFSEVALRHRYATREYDDEEDERQW